MGGTGSVSMIDERMHAALARLTDNEKECLRRRLQQQTAKEMALELGVSPHAVEKRLKMARTKLGLSSSLEAARLLVTVEGYQRTGPLAADLATITRGGEYRASSAASPLEAAWGAPPRAVYLASGVLLMILLTAAALVLAAQSGSNSEADKPSPYAEPDPNGPQGDRAIDQFEFVEASPERVRRYVMTLFEREDKDKSGFIEPDEGPDLMHVMKPRNGPRPAYDPANVAEELRGKAAQDRYIEVNDDDRDGRLSEDEYVETMIVNYERGIPLLPADWSEGPG